MKTVPKQWDTQFEGKVIEKQETFPITLSCTCTCVVNIMYCMFIRTFLYFVSIEFCFSFKNIIFCLFLYPKMEEMRFLVIHYCATLHVHVFFSPFSHFFTCFFSFFLFLFLFFFSLICLLKD